MPAYETHVTTIESIKKKNPNKNRLSMLNRLIKHITSKFNLINDFIMDFHLLCMCVYALKSMTEVRTA